jgi:phosphoribosylamine-glycine ligase
MKILVHSNNGDGIALAERFKAEGNTVKVYIEESSCRKMGDGLVDHVDSVNQGLAMKPDFILFDMSGAGELADRLRKSGEKVIGASALADKMETDRKFGLDLAKKHGIKVPNGQDFTKIEDAESFIKTNPKAYAIKMSGGECGCASSYVSKDAKDMFEYIEWQKERKLIKPGMEFVLQEVVKGVEISTEVWFSEGKPLLPYNSTFEIKKFMPGDLGPNTGCETSAVFPYLSATPKMVQKTISKIFPFLLQNRWSGPIDVNCIVSEKDSEPYFLEWTPRLGYSAIYALVATFDGDLSRFFYDVSRGTNTRVPIKHTWGMSLKVSVPPYPVERPDQPDVEHALYKDTEGLRVKSEQGPHIWPIDAKKGKSGGLECAGVNGIIMECTGVGETMEKAWNGAKKLFEAVEVPNKQGRVLDGMDSAHKRAKKLRGMGYYEIPNPDGQISGRVEAKAGNPPLLLSRPKALPV